MTRAGGVRLPLFPLCHTGLLPVRPSSCRIERMGTADTLTAKLPRRRVNTLRIGFCFTTAYT